MKFSAQLIEDFLNGTLLLRDFSDAMSVLYGYTAGEIEESKNLINWNIFGRNISVNWDAELIKACKERINWADLSGNPGLVFTSALLDEFSDYWDASSLSANPSLPTDRIFLKKHWQLFKESVLLTNRNLDWSVEELVELFSSSAMMIGYSKLPEIIKYRLAKANAFSDVIYHEPILRQYADESAVPKDGEDSSVILDGDLYSLVKTELSEVAQIPSVLEKQRGARFKKSIEDFNTNEVYELWHELNRRYAILRFSEVKSIRELKPHYVLPRMSVEEIHREFEKTNQDELLESVKQLVDEYFNLEFCELAYAIYGERDINHYFDFFTSCLFQGGEGVFREIVSQKDFRSVEWMNPKVVENYFKPFIDEDDNLKAFIEQKVSQLNTGFKQMNLQEIQARYQQFWTAFPKQEYTRAIYDVQPGIGVGPVMLGMTQAEVLAVIGIQASSKDKRSLYFTDRNLSLHFRQGKLDEIDIRIRQDSSSTLAVEYHFNGRNLESSYYDESFFRNLTPQLGELDMDEDDLDKYNYSFEKGISFFVCYDEIVDITLWKPE